jgi:hypothetical protein
MQKYKPLLRAKLSKKFFMQLEDGVFLTSNCTNENAKPIFAQEVWPMHIRALQWQLIVDVGASHRLCEIFQSKEDFEETYFDRVLKWRMGENVDI